jgi:hypothetical protein
MKLTKRSVVLLALMMLFIILFSVLTGIAGLTVDNLLPEDDDHLFVGSFMAIWGRMTVHQILSGLMLGISILALFGVYLGGRSNHRRFNDRTLDSMHLFGDIVSRRLHLEPSLFSCSSQLTLAMRAGTGMKSHSSNHFIVLRRY